MPSWFKFLKKPQNPTPTPNQNSRNIVRANKPTLRRSLGFRVKNATRKNYNAEYDNKIENFAELFKKNGPKCNSEGYYQHTGQCWHDALQMIFIWSDGLKETVQKSLATTQINEDYINEIATIIDKDTEPILYTLLKTSAKDYFTIVQNRFKRHYVKEQMRQETYETCSQSTPESVLYKKIREISSIQRTKGNQGIQSEVLAKKENRRISPGGNSDDTNTLIKLYNIFFFEGNLFSKYLDYRIESELHSHINEDVNAVYFSIGNTIKSGPGHVICFYVCGGVYFLYDNNYGPIPFKWREFNKLHENNKSYLIVFTSYKNKKNGDLTEYYPILVNGDSCKTIIEDTVVEFTKQNGYKSEDTTVEITTENKPLWGIYYARVFEKYTFREQKQPFIPAARSRLHALERNIKNSLQKKDDTRLRDYLIELKERSSNSDKLDKYSIEYLYQAKGNKNIIDIIINTFDINKEELVNKLYKNVMTEEKWNLIKVLSTMCSPQCKVNNSLTILEVLDDIGWMKVEDVDGDEYYYNQLWNKGSGAMSWYPPNDDRSITIVDTDLADGWEKRQTQDNRVVYKKQEETLFEEPDDKRGYWVKVRTRSNGKAFFWNKNTDERVQIVKINNDTSTLTSLSEKNWVPVNVKGEWIQVLDADGDIFYWNKKTGKSEWTLEGGHRSTRKNKH